MLHRLALESSSDHNRFISEFSGNDRDVTDYLGEVVLNQQTAEIRHFLLWTSPLHRFNADLCTHVTQNLASQKLLEQIESNNLFLIPLDRKRTWYRYHHLFGDFLKSRFHAEYPGKEAEVNLAAANWSAENGFGHEAIRYAFAARDLDRAAELMASYSMNLVQNQGEHWTLLNWLNHLPDHCLLRWPEIRLAYVWSLIFARKLTQARMQLDALAQIYDTSGTCPPKAIGTTTMMNWCLLHTASDATKQSRQLTEEWLAKNREAKPQDVIAVKILLAHATLSSYEYNLGDRMCASAIALGRECQADYLVAWSHAVAAMLRIEQGDLSGAIAHCRNGLEFNGRIANSHSYMASLLSILLAEALCEQNQLTEAEIHIRDRFSYIDKECIVEVAYAGYTVQSNLELNVGRLENALSILRLGQESAQSANLPRLVALLGAREISILAGHGLLPDARQHARDLGLLESKNSQFCSDQREAIQEISTLVQAELFLHEGRPTEAAEMLSPLIKQAHKFGRKRRLLTLLVLRAQAAVVASDHNTGLRDLGNALAIASAGRWIRPFVNASAEIHQLIRTIHQKVDWTNTGGESRAFNAYMQSLLDAIGSSDVWLTQSSKNLPQKETLIETLTKRESQLLELLANGNSNREIASKLFISEQTVKWHLHQVYGKLGVANRTSAIAKARRLSLID